MATETKTTKGQQSRARILECALAMFRERGYDATTMRAIADEAGVSPGNAYYYFASKDHLIHEYYARSHADHLATCLPALEDETDLTRRLTVFLQTKVDTSEPYHRFAGQLFKTAADPKSPLSPFSEESRAVREESVALLARVVSESDTRVTGKLAEELPELLWLYQMGVILFWIHDDSAECRRTRALIERTADLVVRLIKLGRLPPMRPLVSRALRMVREMRGDEFDR